MAAIHATDTKPELKIRKALFARGYRYRLYSEKLPGKPDLVLPKYRTAIFIHGCFWHGHENCYLYKKPRSHSAFWSEKIEQNRIRDRKVTAELLERGWRVLVIWKCSIKGRYRLSFDELISEVESFLHSERSYEEIRSRE